MPRTRLRGRQIQDEAVISEQEIKSTYKSTLVSDASEFPITVDSVDGTSGQVTVSGIDLTGLEALPEDIAEITNSDGADGDYTIDSIDSSTTFTVKESISDATSGDLNIYNPVGARYMGVNNNNWSVLTASDVQATFDEIDELIQEATSWDSGRKNLPGGKTYVFSQFRIPSGMTLEIYRAGVQLRDQTTLTGVEVQVYDLTNSTIQYNTDSLSVAGNPLVSLDGPINVALRVSNTTNSTEQVLGHLRGNMR